jgi:ParB-like chromosome segregation protein Spo0J
VVRRNGVIEAGNGLYRAAVALGWKEIAAVFVDDDEDYAKGYALIDNKSGDTSSFDLPTLRDALGELDSGAFDLEATGFQRHEIEMLMTGIHQDDEEAKGGKAPVTCPSCGHVFTPE